MDPEKPLALNSEKNICVIVHWNKPCKTENVEKRGRQRWRKIKPFVKCTSLHSSSLHFSFSWFLADSIAQLSSTGSGTILFREGNMQSILLFIIFFLSTSVFICLFLFANFQSHQGGFPVLFLLSRKNWDTWLNVCYASFVSCFQSFPIQVRSQISISKLQVRMQVIQVSGWWPVQWCSIYNLSIKE